MHNFYRNLKHVILATEIHRCLMRIHLYLDTFKLKVSGEGNPIIGGQVTS